MRRKQNLKRWMSLGIAGVLAVGGMAGCGSAGELPHSKNLSKTVEETGGDETKKQSGSATEDSEAGKQSGSTSEDSEAGKQGGSTSDDETTDDFVTDTAEFSVRLLQESMEEENVMVSPLSVLEALAMTANGAEGDTAEQMQQVLGTNQTREELNENLRSWNKQLSEKEEVKMNIANAIWFREDDGISGIKEEFLGTNNTYYGAGIYASDFSEGTVSDINKWVSEKTDGKINKIVDKLPAGSRMCLVNAVSFEAEWEQQYEENDVIEKYFTMESGTKKTMEMMSSEEDYYLEDANATGVRKPYKDGYSFVALLPNEGTSLAEYVDSLTGEQLLETLEAEQSVEVTTMIPKFTSEYSTSLNDALKNMGMPSAFDSENADFSGMSDVPLFISDVMHKTYIEVDEQGTKASAATAVMMMECAMVDTEEKKEVILDRPFVYAIIEDETMLPVFIGVFQG